jgi:hypothetical protein
MRCGGVGGVGGGVGGGGGGSVAFSHDANGEVPFPEFATASKGRGAGRSDMKYWGCLPRSDEKTLVRNNSRSLWETSLDASGWAMAEKGKPGKGGTGHGLCGLCGER